jgi:hypothetical protein
LYAEDNVDNVLPNEQMIEKHHVLDKDLLHNLPKKKKQKKCTHQKVKGFVEEEMESKGKEQITFHDQEVKQQMQSKTKEEKKYNDQETKVMEEKNGTGE